MESIYIKNAIHAMQQNVDFEKDKVDGLETQFETNTNVQISCCRNINDAKVGVVSPLQNDLLEAQRNKLDQVPSTKIYNVSYWVPLL